MLCMCVRQEIPISSKRIRATQRDDLSLHSPRIDLAISAQTFPLLLPHAQHNRRTAKLSNISEVRRHCPKVAEDSSNVAEAAENPLGSLRSPPNVAGVTEVSSRIAGVTEIFSEVLKSPRFHDRSPRSSLRSPLKPQMFPSVRRRW